MKIRSILLLLVLLSVGILHALLGAVTAASPQKQPSNRYEVAGIDDATLVPKFLHNLQHAVAAGQRVKVAAMVDYPITVTVVKRKVALNKPADLLRRYSKVFTPKVRQALARQKVEKLFVNQKGVMIGDGEIWFNQPPRSKVLKIIAVNN